MLVRSVVVVIPLWCVCTQYFGSLGWPVVMSPGWTLVAERYGATADYSPDPNRPGPSTLQYTVCVR